MKNLLFISLLILTGLLSEAQTAAITGKWLLVKEKTDRGIEEPYYLSFFRENHVLEIMGMPIGYWEFNKSGDTLNIRSNYYATIAGKSKVVKTTPDEMILSKKGSVKYYSKLHQEEINSSNQVATFMGKWSVISGAKDKVTLNFTAPDNLMVTTVKNGKTKTDQCHWIYNPADKTLIVYGLSNLMRGKHDISEVSANRIVLENNGKTIIAEKK